MQEFIKNAKVKSITEFCQWRTQYINFNGILKISFFKVLKIYVF